MVQGVTVLVGTTKGLFMLKSHGDGPDWRVSGPFCDGWGINHAVGDAASGLLWAGGGGEWTGAGVWRSADGGASWTACRTGLPQAHCYFTVLRQAMAVDRAPAPGLCFGTNSGSVFASTDEGDSWTEIARHLPTVLCVETVTAG